MLVQGFWFVAVAFSGLAQSSALLYSENESFGLQSRSESLLQCLQRGLSKGNAAVETSGSPDFASDTIRYTSIAGPDFGVVAKVYNEKDVKTSIDCAVASNTTFLATAPRHGISTTLSSIKQGLQIDMSAFNKVTYDKQTSQVTTGAAVVFQQVIDELYAQGKEIPTGSCYCVGMVGATLGGGVGRLNGRHGLTLDNLVSAWVMLPNTKVVQASKTKNKELFWGLRGAGFNFGVVLNATYQSHTAANKGQHLNADFIFPITQAESYYKKLAVAAKNQPPELSILSVYNFDPFRKETVLTVNAVYAGPENQGKKAIQFILDQKPVAQNITMVPWNQLIQSALFGATGPVNCERGRRITQWSVAVDKIDPPTYGRIATMFADMIKQYPTSVQSAMDTQLLPNQAVKAVPRDSTAYPWRDTVAHVLLTFGYTDDTTTDEITGYPKKMRDALIPTAGTKGFQVYVSYGKGDESLETKYSAAKLPRLAALKKKIDPSGLFNAYHPVPTSYP